MTNQNERIRPDGGRLAARGFQYQYLRTLEYMLMYIDDPAIAAIRIEGPRETENLHTNAIDFDVTDMNNRCLLAAQVKSKTPEVTVSVSEAFSALTRLISTYEAETYVLLTNGRPAVPARKLAQVLSDQYTSAELKTKLRILLSDSPARLAQLENLPLKEIERLGRCSVVYDGRDETEIREALRETLRAYRNRARAGLGEQSAGLLTGYLVSEILRRAADAREAVYSKDQLRSQLLVSAQDLARVGGVRDWGIVVGAIPYFPDITRPELLHAVEVGLGKPEGSTAKRVALVGPSGIGKTSLASAYIADRADSYEFIFWIDCETEESIVKSFRQVAAFIGDYDNNLAYSIPPDYLRQVIHTELSRTTGRWLMVFDNVTNLRQAEIWMPRAGTGHIITTSVDSSARYGTATIVDVGEMETSQAVELLCQRLNVDDGDRERYSHQLDQLANGLSRWPLALELASGYMDACGIRLDETERFLSQLKIHSLADAEALPPVYPRTLFTAVLLCLELLRVRANTDDASGDNAYLALGMMQYAAFLGSRQLPCHMLAAAVVVTDQESESLLGVWVIDPVVANMGEVIRELRHFSLVNLDDDLPGPGNQLRNVTDVGRTITLNSITQEIIRNEIEKHPEELYSLNRLANHAERWLISALELNCLERMSALFPHAEVLANHLRRLGVVGRHTALLFGNLAGAYQAQGDMRRAADFTVAELEVAAQFEGADGILSVQAKLQLAVIYFASPDRTSIKLETVTSHLEDASAYVQSISSIYPQAAMKLALDGKDICSSSSAKIISSDRIAKLGKRFDRLTDGLAPTEYSETLLAIRKANRMLTKLRFSAAEKLCVRALESGSITGPHELDARLFLVEALTRQRKWIEAQDANRVFRLHFGTASVYVAVITRYVHNVGNACAYIMLDTGDLSAVPLLEDILEWPAISYAVERPTIGSQSRIRLLKAILYLFQGDCRRAESTLLSIQPSDLWEENIHETRGWCALWQMTRLAIFRTASERYLVEG